MGTVTFRVGPWRGVALPYQQRHPTAPRGAGTRHAHQPCHPPSAPHAPLLHPARARLLRCPVLQSPPLLAPPVSSLSPPSRPPPAQAPGGSLPSLRRRRRPVGEVSSAPRARSSLCRPQSVCSVPQPSSRSGLSAPLPPPPNALLA
jgi:hypothetical protein